MATKKQITANRENAKLSSGVNIVEDKAIVAKNAIRHGIFIKDLLSFNNWQPSSNYCRRCCSSN